jgi:hypothetical protein
MWKTVYYHPYLHPDVWPVAAREVAKLQHASVVHMGRQDSVACAF